MLAIISRVRDVSSIDSEEETFWVTFHQSSIVVPEARLSCMSIATLRSKYTSEQNLHFDRLFALATVEIGCTLFFRLFCRNLHDFKIKKANNLIELKTLDLRLRDYYQSGNAKTTEL